jgi:arylsulfatase A-like enzyme
MSALTRSRCPNSQLTPCQDCDFGESSERETMSRPRPEPPRWRGGTHSGRRYSGRRRAQIALIAALFLSSACKTAPPPKRAAESPPNVVLIVLDTVRASTLMAAMDSGASAPNLAALAVGARVYRNAHTPAPLTMPAMAAVMAGRYAHTVGIFGHSRRDRLAATTPLLAESAKLAGYRTVAIVTNPWLALPTSGFTRGFDSFVSGRSLGREQARMDAADVAGLAVAEIRKESKEPLFLWLHFMDAHMPYGGRDDETEITRDFVKGSKQRSAIFFDAPYSPGEITATVAAYERSIGRIDAALGLILAALPDNTIIVLLADHGESLGEHGLHFAHDFTLYEELLRVPLIVRVAGNAKSDGTNTTSIDSPVSLLDVAPTICVLADWPCPDDFEGKPLPSSDSDPEARENVQRVLFAATTPQRSRYACPWISEPGPAGRVTAAIRDGRKVIRFPSSTGAHYQAFDLRHDPGERENLFDPTKDAALAAHLDSWSTAAAGQETGHSVPLPRNSVRELRALGYLE